MRIHEVRAVGALCLALALSGCSAGYTPRIRKSEMPTVHDTYLYGRFAIDAPEVILGMDSHPSMGFVIQCASGKAKNTYTIRFSVDAPLQVIKIAPGVCTLREFVYSDADGFVKGRRAAPEGLMKNAVFEPATAYYLGDYGARASVGYSNMNWDLTSVQEDYEGATRELDATFPNLASLPRQNRMIGKAAQ
jgi:hypothetical protein